MSDVISSAQGGRAAAIARRQALAAGKSALGPSRERVRAGDRHAPPRLEGAAADTAPVPPVTGPAPAAPATNGLAGLTSGRQAAIERRKLLAGGKAALSGAAPAAREAATAAPQRSKAAAAPAEMRAAAETAPAAQANDGGGCAPCREQARARRATLSRFGRGGEPEAPPARPPRQGRLDYAPKVVASDTQSGQRVTGLRIAGAPNVTGHERGTGQPVSGTQYIGTESGAAFRGATAKVGVARTERGLAVSGTLVRSNVRITGDERGDGITITGEADQTPADDLTPRAGSGAVPMAQFRRQAEPHGSSVFGTNLGRSAGRVGSRERRLAPALEATESGLAITGSAVGRSQRVTGDMAGACRSITGSQYLAPARLQAECGGQGGGTAPASLLGTARPDPAAGGKGAASLTWSGQRVTGLDVEHNRKVTGAAAGACAAVTGSPYQGPATAYGWCETAATEVAASRQPCVAAAAITGDVPVHDAAVTGTARGAARAISGTTYYREVPASETTPASPATIDQRFSVASPQRSAQLRSAGSAEGQRITGSFAVGENKVTGNIEFLFRRRQPAETVGDAVAAHDRLTGEGRSQGSRITGDAWTNQTNVTGTDGAFAADRNPSERGPKAKAFAGSTAFKAQSCREEPKQLVTGTFGFSSKSAARVTLSGGAQG